MDLYVSDLDGTLLTSKQELSPETVSIINALIGQRMNFSIATARSFDSAGRIIAPLNLRLPMVVHNGVYVYDPVAGRNILANHMEADVTREILKRFEEHDIHPLVFAVDGDGENRVYYKGFHHPGEEAYIKGRLAGGDRRFRQIKDYEISRDHRFVTLVAIHDRVMLDPLHELCKKQYPVGIHYGEDIYSKSQWLEITHPAANKKQAVAFLKEYTGADRLICFGDNLNDLPMFEIADVKCAVSNANELLKKAANRITGSNNEDGVARFIQEGFSA